MADQSFSRVTCDHCGANGPRASCSLHAHHAARKAGWLSQHIGYGNYIDTCPQCQADGKNCEAFGILESVS